MAGDYLVPVAHWLANHRADHHQFADLGAVVNKTAPARTAELEAVRAAVELLDAVGLAVFYHHSTQAAVAAQHRAGLRRIAAGESLTVVAQAVELDRPVTIVRVRPDQYAAWYRSPLRLPVGATATATDGALGATPDEALAALRDQALAACRRRWPADQVTACQ